MTSLYLSGNQLTEVPKGLEKFTQLKGLNLYGNKLTGVKRLEKLTELTMLDLNRNPIRAVDDGVIYINGIKTTIFSIADLKKALPKCKILH